MGPAVRDDVEECGLRRLRVDARAGDQVEPRIPPDMLYLSYVRSKGLVDDGGSELAEHEIAVHRYERGDQVRARAELIARAEAIRCAVDPIAIGREEQRIETQDRVPESALRMAYLPLEAERPG